jgi:hypothetical protein
VSEPLILWQAAPGVQTDWHRCSALEKFLAGGAGAGKSSCLTAEAAVESANPAMRSLLLRLSYPQLKDLIAATHLIYAPMRAKFNVTLHTWTFPSGATVEFAAIESTQAAIVNFSGRSWSFIGVDELVQLPGDTVDVTGQMINGAYSFLKSRLRAVEGSGLSLTLASTGTPGGVGQAWVRSYFGIEGGQSCETKDPITGTRRAYFHCTVADNPALRNTNYAERLKGLPTSQKKALLFGDWSSYVGQVFSEWDQHVHTCDPFPIPSAWELWRGCDDGYASKAAVLWLARDEIHDRIFIINELYQSGLTAEQMAREILRIDKRIERKVGFGAGSHVQIYRHGEALAGVVDSASFADNTGGGGRGDEMNRLGCQWTPCVKDQNSRIAGKSLIHERLAMKSDGKPGLIVFSNCKNLIRTLPTLCYSKSRPEDVDTDAEDHLYDALRYSLSWRKLKAGRVRIM